MSTTARNKILTTSTITTMPQPITVVQNWTLEHFDHQLTFLGEGTLPLTSELFPLEHHGIQFKLSLHSNGATVEDKGFLSVFLVLVAPNWTGPPLPVMYKFAIVNKKGKEKHCKITESKFKHDQSWGWVKYISHQTLKAESRRLLPGGQLKIRCEVTFLNHIVSSVASAYAAIPSAPALDIDALKQLLEKPEHGSSDITVTVDDEVLPAHKVILAAGSPVFANAFKENNSKASIIDLNVPQEAFADLLKYLYSGQIPEKDRLTGNLLLVANKYQVKPLKAACEQHLIALVNNLPIETVRKLLSLAKENRAEKLKLACIHLIIDKTGQELVVAEEKGMMSVD